MKRSSTRLPLTGLVPLGVLAVVLAMAGIVPGQAASWKFIAVGDTRNASSSPAFNATIVAELANEIVAQHAQFVLVPGDLVYSGTLASFQQWRQAMDPVYQNGIGVYPVMGNHDVADVPGFIQTFGDDLPDNGPDGERNRTYAFSCDNALILGLDTYANVGRVNQPWIDSILTDNTLPHVFAFGHMPAFKANHTDCLDDDPAGRDAFWNSLKQAGCRLYFCGHDHFYDHLRIDDGDGDVSNDVHQCIVGSGGAPFTTTYAYNGNNTTWNPVGLYHEVQFGYALIEVNGPSVTTSFYHRLAASTYVPAGDVWTYSVAPAAPVGLAATAGDSLVQLTWSLSPGATSYNVKRGAASVGTFVLIGSGVAGTSYTDTTAINGTTYYYVVSALNTFESPDSAPTSATPLAAPTGLTATPGNGKVTLAWNPSTGATAYHVKRRLAGGNSFVTIASPASTGYVDSSVSNGTTYFYVVTALAGTSESGPSAYIGVTPQGPPAPPAGLNATAGNAQVTLNWTGSTGATTYTVRRGFSSTGPWNIVATDLAATSYIDTSVLNGTTYYYSVTALNAFGESAPSTAVMAKPQASVPKPPSSLAAVSGPNKGQITVTWSLATGATSYNVKRATKSGGPYHNVATGLNAATYTDSKLKSGTAYYYVVTALNSAGESPISNEASARAK